MKTKEIRYQIFKNLFKLLEIVKSLLRRENCKYQVMNVMTLLSFNEKKRRHD